MLEQFDVTEQDAVRVDEDSLRKMVVSLFEKVGVPSDDAALGADALVTADLRGVDSHGVSNMLRYYIEGFNSGDITANPLVKTIRESLATATLDCDGGLGIIIAPKAMDMAIEKAKHTGMGMVTMRNGRHLGMASYHAMRALDHNMIGICMTAVGPAVVPTFGKEPRLGTNPIAVAVPAANQHPFVLDFATSVVPVNKMRLAERIGSVIPGGWIADTAGVPIMQEGPAPEYAPGQLNLLPLGSNREGGSHKGYGLAGFVEILCGILSGGGFAGMGGQRGDSRHMVAAYSIDAFSPVDEFKAMMDEWMDYLKSTPPADGHERVLVPGQPEHEEETDRRSRGIPLHKEVIQWFRDISEELEVPYVL